MKRMKRFFKNEDGFAMLQISFLLGFVAIAILTVLFVVNAGGGSVGAYIF
jgi:Flp pilus assembly pilin Flp